MRWFKHMTMAHNDEKMSAVLEEIGPAAYGVYWLIMEDIGAALEKNSNQASMVHSELKWSQIAHSSVRGVRSIIKSLADRHLISVTSVDDRLRIEIPNLLKYRDEYSEKSRHASDKLTSRVDQIQSRTDQSRADVKAAPEKASPENGSADKRGTRLSIESLPPEWEAWASAEYNWSRERSVAVFAEFRDYWIARPGKDGRKSDWQATWRNRCRDVERHAATRKSSNTLQFPEKKGFVENVAGVIQARLQLGVKPL